MTMTDREQTTEQEVLLSTLGATSGHGSTLLASFQIETYKYYHSYKFDEDDKRVCYDEETTPLPALVVSIKSATTTRGGNIVSDEYDATGIMIWPATHLLCQHFLSSSSSCGVGDGGTIDLSSRPTVLELGCGCGLVGVVAMNPQEQGQRRKYDDHEEERGKQQPKMWVSTDMDEAALTLCKENFALNGIPTNESQHLNDASCSHKRDDGGVFVKCLQWGKDEDIINLQSELQLERFDVIVGADIIYPNTSGKILTDLFHTVERLLSHENGLFYLSFAARDGPKTPSRLIEAASNAGYVISIGSHPLDSRILKSLPPLLGSKILVLERSTDAGQLNHLLGQPECTVFPGLQAALARLDESSSEEEWDAPFS